MPFATRRPARMVICCACVVLAIFGLIYFTTGPARIVTVQAATVTSTPIPVVVWSIDTDPGTSGVQTTRTINVGQQFSIDVVLGPYSGPGWKVYSDEVVFNDVVLDATGIPATWNMSPVPNVTSGNLASFASGADCGSGAAALNAEDDAGTAMISMSCGDVTQTTTAYTGAMSEFVFRCEHTGYRCV